MTKKCVNCKYFENGKCGEFDIDVNETSENCVCYVSRNIHIVFVGAGVDIVYVKDREVYES
ncbi:MAG: hypothetical protein NWE91_01920 [Candidatus Bathyarchaeota archaeon]|nr:hypothetical protein [Candidatus Bathyarchaeota archaeon]